MGDIRTGLADSLRKFICDELGYEPAEVGDETFLFSTGLVDSFTFVGMVALIETHIGEQLDPGAITVENFDSIARIELFLHSHTG